jgi:hypothetical protein
MSRLGGARFQPRPYRRIFQHCQCINSRFPNSKDGGLLSSQPNNFTSYNLCFRPNQRLCTSLMVLHWWPGHKAFVLPAALLPDPLFAASSPSYLSHCQRESRSSSLFACFPCDVLNVLNRGTGPLNSAPRSLRLLLKASR